MARKRMIKFLIGAVAGGVVGYLYYHFIGCRSGVCFLTSNPYRSIIIWALIGVLAANVLVK